MSAAASAPLVRKEYSLSFKVHEAKELVGDLVHGCDPYASVMIDHQEVSRTKTVWNTKEPVWDQDYYFDLASHFNVLSVVVWDENRKVKDIPLGKATLTKSFLLKQKPGGVEQWMQLAPAETEGTVTGDVHLEVSYYHPTAEVPNHTFSVNVLGARDLVPRDANGYSDPYAVLHVLPDPDTDSTRHTKVVTKNLNPEFNENFTFTFDLNKNIEEFTLHLSMWDWSRYAEHEFMGHLCIPFSEVLEAPNLTVNKWFHLLPAPVSIKLENDGKFISLLKPMIKRQSRRAGSMHGSGQVKNTPDLLKGKSFVKNFQALPADHSTRIDKPRGSVRLFFKFSEDRILPRESYNDLISVIAEDKYLLASLLGKWSSSREDAARTLIKIFENQNRAQEFLFGVIDQEVMSTSDPNTIFRGNSMASKGVDVYMKLTAMPYLKRVIQPIIHDIVAFKKSCEVDPTRLEKNDDIAKNWKNLINFCEVAFDSIMKSSTDCPLELCEVFHFLRTRVMEKFPDNEFVPYTSVSGFIFLRFFCPAILGPTLFGLWDEHIEKVQARSLTLVAKTLQNLGNLVEFGYKEVYMKDMNPFIMQRMDDMKKFIDRISLMDKSAETHTKGGIHESLDFAKECSHLHQHFQDARAKISENATESERPLVTRLEEVLDRLNSQLQQEEEKITKKREQDRANRRSAAMALQSGEAKVAMKALPLGPSTLSTLDSLLDDLDAVTKTTSIAIDPLAAKDLRRPPGLQPPSYRPPEVFSTDEEAFEAIQKGVPSRPAEEPKRLSAQLIPARTNSPRDENARPISPFSNTSSPQIPSSPRETASTPRQSIGGKSAIQNLEDLLQDLGDVVIKPTEPTPAPAPAAASTPDPVPTPAVVVEESPSIAPVPKPVYQKPQPTEPKEHRGSMRMNLGDAPKKDDSSAIDDLLGDFDAAATKVIKENESKNSCMYCQNSISEPNFHTWAGLKWHHGHFKCNVCDIDLAGSKFYFHEDRLYCVNDYQSVFTCSCCGLHISDSMAEALGRKYHSSCFCCSMCEEPLVGAFHMDDEGNLFCKEDWLVHTGMICTVCNELIPGGFVNLGENKYHPECFTCQECNQSIAGREYVITDNKLYCASHFRCAACNGVLDSQVVCALGKKFHVGHFTCNGCKRSLVGEPFYERDGKPWCGPCNGK